MSKFRAVNTVAHRAHYEVKGLTSLSITGNIDPIYHHTTRTTHRRAPSDRLRAPLQVLNTEVTDTSRERPYAHTTQTNTPKQWYALESTSILLADVPRWGCGLPHQPRPAVGADARKYTLHALARTRLSAHLSTRYSTQLSHGEKSPCHRFQQSVWKFIGRLLSAS